AKFDQLLYLFDRSINLNRSHGTSYLGDDAIISYVALFMQGYIILKICIIPITMKKIPKAFLILLLIFSSPVTSYARNFT
ncbi:MAG: hypothetical protein AB1638_05980, partial [Nitrospirota bacterium]